jgi:glycosyltransferase involved in cell wall biosynthesis
VSVLLAPNGLPLGANPYLDAPLKGPKVLSLVGDASACALWRTWMPFAELRRRGYPAEWVGLNDPNLGIVPLEPFDAVVLNRLAWREGERAHAADWFAHIRARGPKILYECDDDLFTPFMVEQQKAGVEREKTREVIDGEREATLWAMRQCDGVTVTTQHLATTVRRFTDKPVEVVPNAIDADWFRFVQRQAKRTVPGVTIGWAGGNRPDADLTQMATAWGRIAKRYPDVTFVVVGYQSDAIWGRVPHGRIKAVPWFPPGEYPKALVDIDIGCCPLEERPFNRCKTPIKAWEYALSGAAVVASPTVYRHSIEDKVSGLLCTTADEWEEALSILVERPGIREMLAAVLKRDVMTHWALRPNAWRWPAAWERLCAAASTAS